MGFWANLTAAVLPTVAPSLPRTPPGLFAPVSASSAPPLVELGADGVANFAGRVQWEPLADLRDQAGFGRSGTTDWGFWENLEASNSFVRDALDFTTSPIGDARIDVEPPDIADKAVAAEVTDFVKWCLTERLRLGSHLTKAARGALKSGFSLFEPTYALVQEGRWAGRYCIDGIHDRLPQSLAANPWREEGGKLVAIRQQTYIGGRSLIVDLPTKDVLLYIWQRQGNNWPGRSAFRSVQYIAGKVMPALLKLVGVTYQREGAGIPTVVSTDKDAKLTTEQRAELVDLLANLTFHENANVVMPAGWSLEWIFSPGANKGHVLDAWRQLGIVVLQQLGAQQLALGTNDTGSRSVGEVHDARSAVKVREVLRFLESVINGDEAEDFTGLIPRLCKFNGWTLSAYPRVKLTMQRPELPVKDLADAVSVAVTSGALTVTLDDENAMRERLGFAPIDAATRDAMKRAAPASAAPIAAAPLKASAQRGPWKPWRVLRASEEKVKFSSIDDYFTRRRDDFEKAMRPAVVAMLAKAAPSIQSAMSDGDPSEVASLPFDTKRIESLVSDFLNTTRKTGADFAREELGGNVKLMRGAEGDVPSDAEVIDDADAVQDAQGKALVRRILNRVRGDIEREAIDTWRTGGDVGDVISRVVDRQMETGAFRGDAGSVVTKIFNVGRDEAARLVGGVDQVELTAILDSATCGPCRALDGTRADFNSPQHDALVPPVRDCAGGDNCRCLLVFIPSKDGGS